MLKEIIEEAMGLPNRKEQSLIELKYSDLLGTEKKKTKRSFLADNLIRLIKDKKILFVNHGDLFVCAAENFVLALRKSEGEYADGYDYILTIARDNKLLKKFSNNSADYDEWSTRRPIMDLYDIVATRKLRKFLIRHVCGLQGFGQSSSDRCSACEN